MVSQCLITIRIDRILESDELVKFAKIRAIVLRILGQVLYRGESRTLFLIPGKVTEIAAGF